jgi:hypothetical protein
LKCWDLIRRLTIEQTNNLSPKLSHIQRIKLSASDKIFIDNELTKIGLPKCKSLLAFKRAWPKFKPSPQHLHVDWFGDDEINHVSIVFPVENCQGTAQFWYNGDYRLHKEVIGTNSITAYYKVIGGNLDLLDQVEIFDSPMIIRTDIPHSAYCGSKYRLVCTLRFETNIDIETSCSKLSS